MSYSGIITSMVVQEHSRRRALCELLRPDGLNFLTAKTPGEQPGTCVPPFLHHNLPCTVWGAVATSHHPQGQPAPVQTNMSLRHLSLSACPGLFVQHMALTFHQYFGDFCVAGTEGTVQLEPVSVVKKGSTQGK